jgi:hypothetical protein
MEGRAGARVSRCRSTLSLSSPQLPSEDSQATMPDPISPTAYFSGQKPPTNLDETTAKVKAFVERMTAEGKRVVLVTVSLLLPTSTSSLTG